MNFIKSEDDRKLLFISGANKQQCWIGTIDGIFIEEFDAARSGFAIAATPFFNVLAVQKVISQVIFGNLPRDFS